MLHVWLDLCSVRVAENAKRERDREIEREREREREKLASAIALSQFIILSLYSV